MHCVEGVFSERQEEYLGEDEEETTYVGEAEDDFVNETHCTGACELCSDWIVL
jgi:hypothetical protein